MRLPRLPGVLSVLTLLVAATSYADDVRVYDLGHYPGGSWAEVRSINDSGLVVAFGDIPEGWTRPIAVPLYGPHARQWFDLGTLGGDRADNDVMCMGVADNGMIVGHAALPSGEPVHGFAWTPQSRMVDLGTLPGDRTWSLAYNVNRSGTLIVGWSSSEFLGEDALPVVWTPKLVWGRSGPRITWAIHTLDMTGFEQGLYWYAADVNTGGQIIGYTYNDGADVGILWNPLPGGKGWKVMQLPVAPGYTNAYPSHINERGEVVGVVYAADYSSALPALWKPADPRRSVYTLTLLPTLPDATPSFAWASGINDVGDIVGDGYDAKGNDIAARWSTRNPSFVETLPFPGTWSFAYAVNNNGIAVGSYGSDTIPENVAAVRIKPKRD